MAAYQFQINMFHRYMVIDLLLVTRGLCQGRAQFLEQFLPDFVRLRYIFLEDYIQTSMLAFLASY